MALPSARVGRCVRVAVRLLAGRSASTSPVGSARTLHGFEGVQVGFCWDHKNGFGYTSDGQIVIISPENSVDINTLPCIEDGETRAILEVAKETYQEKHTPEGYDKAQPSRWSGAERGTQGDH